MVSTIAARNKSRAARLPPGACRGVALVFVLAVLGTRAGGEPPAPVDNADWTAAAEIQKHLGKAVAVDSVSIRPPADYVQGKHPKAAAYEAAGIKVHLWQKEATGSSLIVTLFPSRKGSRGTPRSFYVVSPIAWLAIGGSPPCPI